MNGIFDYDCIVISPHLDDAVLSLFGYIYSSKEKKKLILNIFSGVPSEVINLSDLAKTIIQQDLNISKPDLIDAINYYKCRLNEDREVMDNYKFDYYNMGLLDAIFRGNPPFYPKEESLFKAINSLDEILITKISKFIKRNFTKKCKMIFPLAIGNHVDHQIVYEVGKNLSKEGYNCFFYEDFPYSSYDNEQIINYPCKNPIYIDLSKILDKKVEAISRYESQIQGLFGNKENISLTLNQYFKKNNNLNYAFERIWSIK